MTTVRLVYDILGGAGFGVFFASIIHWARPGWLRPSWRAGSRKPIPTGEPVQESEAEVAQVVVAGPERGPTTTTVTLKGRHFTI